MKQFISPEGQVVGIDNLAQFCRDRDLSYTSMVNVASGRTIAHRGWKLPEGAEPQRYPRSGRPAPAMVFVSPDGKAHDIDNLSAFCRERCLNRNVMRMVWQGIFRQHKGWRRASGPIA